MSREWKHLESITSFFWRRNCLSPFRARTSISFDGWSPFVRKKTKQSNSTSVFFFFTWASLIFRCLCYKLKHSQICNASKKTGIESKGRNETNKRRIRRKQSFSCCCCGRNEFSCRPSASTSRCRCPKLLPLLLPLRLINNYLPPETFRRVFQKSPL